MKNPARFRVKINTQSVGALVASNAELSILGKLAAARVVKCYGLKTVGLTSYWYAGCVKGRGLHNAISALQLRLK